MNATQENINFHARVAELREDIEEVKAQLSWLEKAPIPIADAKRNATEAVAALQANFKELRLPGAFFSPDRKTPPRALPGVLNQFQAPAQGLLLLVAGAMGDRLEAVLHEGIDDFAAKTKLGPARSERKKQKEALERLLFDLERLEESTICEANGQGIEIWRRPDVDPAAVLMLGDFADKPPIEEERP